MMDTRSTIPNTSTKSNVPSANPPQPTRLTPQQMDERREKCLYFNCDNKYSKRHKCGDKKLLYIYYQEEEADDHEPSQAEETKSTTPKEITPTISCHALVGICTPNSQDRRIYQKEKGNNVD